MSIRNRSPFSRIADAAMVIILGLASLICLYPILYVVFASFSDSALLESYNGFLYRPLGFSLNAYSAVFDDREIWRGYANTILYVIVGTTLSVVLTALGAYAITRKKFLWRKPILIMVLITMFFNGGLIPNFLLVRAIGIYDTIWAVILPTAISAWNMFIMRTSFAGIPASIEEAAEIDGANQFQIFVKIILPLSLSVIAVMVLYYGVGRWNAWFNAMIYLRDRTLYPLQLILREILISNSTEDMMLTLDVSSTDGQKVSESIKYATIVVATIPILCVYPFLQKYFVKGVLVGSVKE